jgi:hypothetical protein
VKAVVFATAIVLCVAFTASAQAPKPAQPPLPKRGDSLSVEVNSYEAGLIGAMMNETVRVADPDSAEFDSPCALDSPLSMKVVGADSELVLVRLYAQSARTDETRCRDGSLLMMAPSAWHKLKAVEAKVKAAVDAKSRAKAKIRLMLKLNDACEADPKRPECGR